MKKYEVTRYYSSTVRVEANNEDEARDKAGDIEGSLQLLDDMDDVVEIEAKPSRCKLLNKKLQHLYEMLDEIKNIAPNEQLPDEWEDVFNGVNDLLEYFDDAGTKDGCVPELHEAEIIFSAEGDEDDLNQLYYNIEAYYNEFAISSDDVKEKPAEDNEGKTLYTVYLKGLWIGDEGELVRLTHHAEGFYENTNFEYVHVEVCIDGEWFGRY